MAALDPIFLAGLVFVSACASLAYLAWNAYPDERRLIVGLSIVNAGLLLFLVDFGHLPDQAASWYTETVASVTALAWASLIGVGLGITAFAAHENRQKDDSASDLDATVKTT